VSYICAVCAEKEGFTVPVKRIPAHATAAGQ